MNGSCSASDIFGYPDGLKLKFSMTSFASVSEDNSIFDQIIESYFDGELDNKTIEIVRKIKLQ